MIIWIMSRIKVYCLLVLIFITGCTSVDEQFDVTSPDGRTKIVFILSEGMPYYQLYYTDTLMIDTSSLGITLKDGTPLSGPFNLGNVKILNDLDNWRPVRGTLNRIWWTHNGMIVSLEEVNEPRRTLDIEIRSFDDGFAIRYLFPGFDSTEMPEIGKEMTQVCIPDEFTVWSRYDHDSIIGYTKTETSTADLASALLVQRPGGATLSIPEPLKSGNTSLTLNKIPGRSNWYDLSVSPSELDMTFTDNNCWATSWRIFLTAQHASKLLEARIIMSLHKPFFAESKYSREDSIIRRDSLLPGTERIIPEFSPPQSTLRAYEWSLSETDDLQAHTYSMMTGSIANSDIRGTLVHNLAALVIFYDLDGISEDLKQKGTDHPAGRFIEEIPSSWDNIESINGIIGDYLVIARKNSGNWFIAAITDEDERELKIPLNFLEQDIDYKAEIYADGDSADWLSNPLDYRYEEKEVVKDDTLRARLAPGGGYAVMVKSR